MAGVGGGCVEGGRVAGPGGSDGAAVPAADSDMGGDSNRAGAAAVGGGGAAMGDGVDCSLRDVVDEVVGSVMQNHCKTVLKASAVLDDSSQNGKLRRAVPLVISEKIRDHLTAIATALVSDCSFALRTLTPGSRPGTSNRGGSWKRQLYTSTSGR